MEVLNCSMSGGKEFGTVALSFPTLLKRLKSTTVPSEAKAKRKDSIMETEKAEAVAAAEKSRRRGRREYCADNVVLVEVPWERVYRGESDELVRRERSFEAEREIALVVCGDADFGKDEKGEPVVGMAVPPPDYFVDRWFCFDSSEDESKSSSRMVSVIVYDDAKTAGEFRRLMKLREKAGGCCKVLEDAEFVAEEVKYLNAEWARLRKIELEKAEKVMVDACVVGGVGQRVLVTRIEGDGVKEGKAVKDALSNAVSGCKEPFMVTAVEDEDDANVKWIVVGAKRKGCGWADGRALIERAKRGGVMFDRIVQVPKPLYERLTETYMLAASSMCSALAAHDRREEVRRKVAESRAVAVNDAK